MRRLTLTLVLFVAIVSSAFAAGTNNFLIFDPNKVNMMSDADYSASTYRQNGATTGIAPSNIHNKLYYQTSIMASAWGEVFKNLGYTVSDSDFNNLVSVLSTILSQIPPGTLITSSAIETPTGYLPADGSERSRTTYANLFSAITKQVTGNTSSGSVTVTAVSSTTKVKVGMPICGPGIPSNTTVASVGSGTLTLSQYATANGTGVALVIAPHGVGDGSTTFNLPDGQSRSIMGAGQGSGLSDRRLGAKIGEETHPLTLPEMPLHGHTITDPGHSHSGSTGGQSADHYHGLTVADGSSGSLHALFSSNIVFDGNYQRDNFNTIGSSNDHYHNFTTNGAYTGITVNSNGSGTAHNTVQPNIVENVYIKY